MVGKKTVVINLIGSPGCGKSTMASYLHALMKMRGYSVDLVTEYTKELIWEESFATFDDELIIFAEQHHRMFRVNGKVDYIITDAPIIQKLYYMPKDLSFIDTFRKLVVEVNSQYHNINFFLERKGWEFEKIGRNHTEDESAQISLDMKQLLVDFGIEFLELSEDTTTIEDADEIIKLANEFYNQTFKENK